MVEKAEITAKLQFPSEPIYAREAAPTEPKVRTIVTAELGRDDAFGGYRPDIDGLRGIAVLLVVAYHLEVFQVRGGFIGVDIFFVISGYLITGLIVRDLADGTFSLGRFYMRRIRRIIPALAVVLAAAGAGSLLFQFPSETRGLAGSLAAAMLFCSNLFFLSNAHYFGGAAYSIPLLHTWSLAIEEQFYLAFPLLVMVLARHGGNWRRNVRSAVLGIALFSFIVSAVLVEINQEAAFYLIVSRAWELAAGALLALGLPHLKPRRWLSEICGAMGLMLVLAAALRYHPALHFPGVLALAPVAGAAGLIYAGNAQWTFVSSLLSVSPLRLAGLVSYSLYLWHWPIIVFWRDITGGRPGIEAKVALFSIAVGIAVLSWRFVEQPMRQPRSLATRHPWAFFSGAAFFAVAFLAVAAIYQGWPGRFTPEQVRLASYLDYKDADTYRRGSCFIDSHIQSASDFDSATCLKADAARPNVLIIGDSHAAHLWRAMADTYPKYNFLQATASGCKPTLGSRGERPCLDLMAQIMTGFLPAAHPDAVILAARWDMNDVDRLEKTIAKIGPSTGAVYVFGPIMTYDTALPRLLAQAELRGRKIIDDARDPSPGHVDSAMTSALAGKRVRYISYYRLLCAGPEGCATTSAGGTPLQWDYGHLTYEGGLLVGSALRARKMFP